jgi:hypothetical protein
MSNFSASHKNQYHPAMLKTVADLTAADLDRIPIWKLVDPSKQDVEPWPKKGAAPLLSIVRTECVASDGTVYVGCAILTKINLISPVVFTSDRRIKLFHAQEPNLEWRKEAYAALGRGAEAFFPLKIAMTVSSQHRPLPMTLRGFIHRSADGAFNAVR